MSDQYNTSHIHVVFVKRSILHEKSSNDSEKRVRALKARLEFTENERRALKRESFAKVVETQNLKISGAKLLQSSHKLGCFQVSWSVTQINID